MKRRRRARELALKGLYAEEISKNSLRTIVEKISSDSGSDKAIAGFASELVKKTLEYKDFIDKNISSVIENWDIDRVALIDRIILRMALCELLYFHEIPPKVTINEAIDLAKKYSTAQSGRFVNGIIDSLYKRLKSEGRIVKRGAGLIE